MCGLHVVDSKTSYQCVKFAQTTDHVVEMFTGRYAFVVHFQSETQ